MYMIDYHVIYFYLNNCRDIIIFKLVICYEPNRDRIFNNRYYSTNFIMIFTTNILDIYWLSI